jgi:syntaxin-binding protein 1
VFTTNMPSTFFTLFGNPGGIVAAELAQDRFEEDVKLMSKSVRRNPDECFVLF